MPVPNDVPNDQHVDWPHPEWWERVIPLDSSLMPGPCYLGTEKPGEWYHLTESPTIKNQLNNIPAAAFNHLESCQHWRELFSLIGIIGSFRPCICVCIYIVSISQAFHHDQHHCDFIAVLLVLWILQDGFNDLVAEFWAVLWWPGLCLWLWRILNFEK